MASGRPTTYTTDIGRRLCTSISKDVPLCDICARANMPSVPTVNSWLSKGDMGDERYVEFSKLYARARQASADVVYSKLQKIEDRIIAPRYIVNPAYSETDAAKAKETGQTYEAPPEILNPDYLDPAAGRAAADIIKWRAARMRPDVYGDRVEVAHSGKVVHEHDHRIDAPDWIKERLGKHAPAKPMIDVTPAPDRHEESEFH